MSSAAWQQRQADLIRDPGGARVNQSRNDEERDARCRRMHRLIADGCTVTAAAKRAGVSKAKYRAWKATFTEPETK